MDSISVTDFPFCSNYARNARVFVPSLAAAGCFGSGHRPETAHDYSLVPRVFKTGFESKKANEYSKIKYHCGSK